MKREEWANNRDMTRQPKRGLSWCDTCDTAKVADGARCKVCRKRQGRKRLKK